MKLKDLAMTLNAKFMFESTLISTPAIQICSANNHDQVTSITAPQLAFKALKKTFLTRLRHGKANAGGQTIKFFAYK